MRPFQTVIQRRGGSDIDEEKAERDKKLALADVRIISGIAAGGLGLLIVLSFWLAVGRVPFIVAAALPLLTLIAIVYQAVVYRRQWSVMQDNLDQTERIVEKMQAQLNGIDRQAKAMEDSVVESRKLVAHSEQAAKDQLFALQGQWKAMDKSLEESRKLVAQNERAIRAAEDNVKTVEKTSIYANRAYLVAKIRNNEPYHFKLAIENGGNTPANNVRVSYACKAMQDPPWQLDEQTNQVVYDTGRDITIQLGVIAPNGSHGTVQTAGFAPRTDIERQEWDGGVKLYCWGWIYYEDIFNEKWHTEFCFYKSLQQPQGHPCDYGNEAF
jgi:hypothetical protein